MTVIYDEEHLFSWKWMKNRNEIKKRSTYELKSFCQQYYLCKILCVSYSWQSNSVVLTNLQHFNVRTDKNFFLDDLIVSSGQKSRLWYR